MKRVASLAEIEWIAAGVRPRTSERASVAHCVPPIYPAYAKLFHPMYEDLAVQSDEVTWQEAERAAPSMADDSECPAARIMQEVIGRSTPAYGGAEPRSQPVRIRWAQLARRLGLPFVPTLSAWSFTRRCSGGSWPKHLIGPEEGNFAGTNRDALVSVLRRHTEVDRCLFHVWLLATLRWKEDLLFEGSLSDALLFPDGVPGVRLTPTHWFPEDRAWFVCTAYDLTFTFIGGSESLVRDLLDHGELECVPVRPETRIDLNADQADMIQ